MAKLILNGEEVFLQEQDIKQLIDKLNSIIKESVDTNTISLTKREESS